MKTIEITVSPKGETSVATSGFVGASCREASRSIEQALGHRLTERLSAEFHQGPEVEQRGQQRLDAGT